MIELNYIACFSMIISMSLIKASWYDLNYQIRDIDKLKNRPIYIFKKNCVAFD